LDALQLRSLIAQEVRGALHDAQRETAPVTAAAPVPQGAVTSAADEPSAPAEPTAGFAPARALVDDRLVAGVWRPADRDALRASLGTLRREERTQLVRDIVQAINAGKLQSDDAEYF
jgi:hypothetical protein